MRSDGPTSDTNVRPYPIADLEALRAKLDLLDERLLETLRERILICMEIAWVKRAHAVPMMQPHRIGLVQRRAARFAADHGLNPQFLRELYELVIAETCRVEDLIMGRAEGTAREAEGAA